MLDTTTSSRARPGLNPGMGCGVTHRVWPGGSPGASPGGCPGAKGNRARRGRGRWAATAVLWVVAWVVTWAIPWVVAWLVAVSLVSVLAGTVSWVSVAGPAFAGPAAGLEAREGTLGAEHRRLVGEKLADLRDLARRYHDAGWWPERDQLARLLLLHVPDDAVVRKWLGYARTEDGRWAPCPHPLSPSRRNPNGAVALARRRAAVVGALAERLWVAYEDGSAAASPAERFAFLRDLLELDPERGPARTANGEVRVGTAWRLVESQTARVRRRQLAEAALGAIRKVDAPVPTASDAPEPAVGMPWRGGWRTSGVRIFTTGDPGEGRKAAATCQAALDLCRTVFGGSQLEEALEVWFLARRVEYEALVRALDIPDAERTRLLQLGGFPLAPGLYVDAGTSPEGRLDGAVRVTLSQCMEDTFDFRTECAWVTEGIGIYLTRLLTGGSISNFVEPSRYAGQEGSDRDAQTADWLASARALAAAGRMPEIPYVLGLSLEAMTQEDLVAACALSAYLLEGLPDRVTPFLQAVGRGDPVDQACLEALGMPVPIVEVRLRRWLEEAR